MKASPKFTTQISILAFEGPLKVWAFWSRFGRLLKPLFPAKFAKNSLFAYPCVDRTHSVGLGPTGMKPSRPFGRAEVPQHIYYYHRDMHVCHGPVIVKKSWSTAKRRVNAPGDRGMSIWHSHGQEVTPGVGPTTYGRTLYCFLYRSCKGSLVTLESQVPQGEHLGCFLPLT